jgi:soluble lytic murein transglycosylase-like protein
MRTCVVAAALIALIQPAFAANKKHPHRFHVSHLAHHHHHAGRHHRVYARLRRAPIEGGYAMPQHFARGYAIEHSTFTDPSYANAPWRDAWAAATPQDGSFAEPAQRVRRARVYDGALDSMIARHAAANGLPIELVRRVVIRESGYNPHARNGGNLGLMQIKHATARGVGYAGPASGLLDPETNLTYAVRYLAGAYRAAGGNANRAIRLYASGYYRRGEFR